MGQFIKEGNWMKTFFKESNLRRRAFKQFCTLCLMLLMLSTSSFGQDFNQLLKAVDKIESNLKALIEKESGKRTAEIIRLEDKMSSTPTSSDNKILAELAEKIEEIQNKLIDMPSNDENISQNDFGSITDDIKFLKSEILSLKESQQSFSNQNTVEANNSNQDFSKLTNQLTSISESLHELAEHDEDEVAPGLDISGFFDVVNSYDQSPQDNTNFGLGQAEVDLAHELANNVAVEIAIAYNADDALFELGAALIDIHISGSDNNKSSHINSNLINHTSLIVGQFDVPFGVDFLSYPSIDRKLVTTSRVVDLTHGGWNDFGVQFMIDSRYGNFVTFLVNGFESSTEVIDDVASLATGVDVYEEINTTPSNAFGFRAGFKQLSNLEIGTSVATGLNKSDKSEMVLWGADLQYDLGYLLFKGEYITHSLNRSVAKEENSGFYFQSIGYINKFFVTGRYGSFKPDGLESIGQFSLGGGYEIIDGVEVRMETLINENSDLNQTMLQMVTEF